MCFRGSLLLNVRLRRRISSKGGLIGHGVIMEKLGINADEQIIRDVTSDRLLFET